MKARPSDPLARVNSLDSPADVRFTLQRIVIRVPSLWHGRLVLFHFDMLKETELETVLFGFFVLQAVLRAARFICVLFFGGFSLCLRLEVSEKLPQG